MKTIILLIIACAFIEDIAQTRPGNIEVPIQVYDNSGLPESSRNLICGIDSMATDSIDSFLGEYWRVCPFDLPGTKIDCPPFDHFEAVLDIPVEPDPNSFEFGSWKDFRQGMIPYSGIKTYKICYCVHNVATALFISWDFPEGVTGLLQDGFGGLIFNYQMPDSGTFTDPILLELQGAYSGVNVVLTYQDVIPVELISFNATLSDNNIQLNWTTATETNNRGFDVQRSVSKRSEVGSQRSDWEKIGFVPGFGTTIEPKSYSYSDQSVKSGIYYYRLKQVDYDGSYEYSDVVKVELMAINSYMLEQNWPNPFNPTTTIGFGIQNKSNVKITVLNVIGEEVAVILNEDKETGYHQVEFNAINLPSGVYFYRITAGNFIQTKKMILLK